MFKKALLAAALVSVSMSASANWVLGVGYSNLSDSEDDIPLFLIADKKILVNPTSKRFAAYAKLNNWQSL